MKQTHEQTVPDLAQPDTAAAIKSFLLGDWEAAHRGFEKLIERDPENHYYSYVLGEINNAMGYLEEAVRRYRNAARKEPDFGVAHRPRHGCRKAGPSVRRSPRAFDTGRGFW